MRIPNAKFDARAPHRDNHEPGAITVEMVSVRWPGGTIADAINADTVPVAVVMRDGAMWQLTSGGSGVVWVQSDTGRFTADQRDALDEITAAFEAEWPHLARQTLTGVVEPVVPSEPLESVLEASDEPVAPVKKRKPRKKAAPKPESDIPFGD